MALRHRRTSLRLVEFGTLPAFNLFDNIARIEWEIFAIHTRLAERLDFRSGIFEALEREVVSFRRVRILRHPQFVPGPSYGRTSIWPGASEPACRLPRAGRCRDQTWQPQARPCPLPSPIQWRL